MSEKTTLGQVYSEAMDDAKDMRGVVTWADRYAAGIAAVADVVARRVFAEGMTAYLAEQDKPVEPPKPEAASEAGDWVMGAANWVVTLYETTGIVTSSEIASRIREAAERHYANVMANDRRGLVETLNSTASALDMAIQDRDAARAECERLQSECTARSASLGMAISVANALADERDVERPDERSCLASLMKISELLGLTGIVNPTHAVGGVEKMKADRDRLAAELQELQDAVVKSPTIYKRHFIDGRSYWTYDGATMTQPNNLSAILAAYRSTKGKEPQA